MSFRIFIQNRNLESKFRTVIKCSHFSFSISSSQKGKIVIYFTQPRKETTFVHTTLLSDIHHLSQQHLIKKKRNQVLKDVLCFQFLEIMKKLSLFVQKLVGSMLKMNPITNY